tara:strand:- start:650 stop:1123 length:474 start_codon:yes stop_codon:yes gene_type:complete
MQLNAALKLWEYPESYAGATHYGSYVFLGQHRDSDTLSESNFAVGLKALGGESETIKVIREGHWGVGWLEWISIAQSDTKALQLASAMYDELEDYPVLCDEHHSELEHTYAAQQWESYSIRDRASLCREAGISKFAARRDCVPNDDQGYIQQSLLGY